jgi:NIPSNAP protein
MSAASWFFVLVALAPLTAFEHCVDIPPAQARVLEIRSYNLKPGVRDRFHELFVRESLPLLRRWKVDVVAYGPSLHDKQSYFLMRAFPSLAERDRIEAAFYASPEWLNGPRAEVLAAIDSYTTIVISADDETLRGLRRRASQD